MKKEKQAYVCARCDLGGTKLGDNPRGTLMFISGTAGTLPVSFLIDHRLEIGMTSA